MEMPFYRTFSQNLVNFEFFCCYFGKLYNFSEHGEMFIISIQAIYHIPLKHLFKQRLVSQMKFMLYAVDNFHPNQANLPLLVSVL